MDLRKGKYILPNLFTLASVLFGVLAIIACFEGTDAGYKRAAIAILAAVCADFLDGRVARLTRTASRFGVELDSLADLVSFGVAPAVLAYSFALKELWLWNGLFSAFLTFMFIACGALRLARFNVMAHDARKPSSWFLGLPIPAAAAAIALATWFQLDFAVGQAIRLLTMLSAMPLLSLAMVSTLRYPSFKRVRWGFASRLAVIMLVAVAIWVSLKTRASGVLLALCAIYVVFGPVTGLVFSVLKQRQREASSSDFD